MIKQLSSRIVYENKWMSVREDSVIRPGGNKGIFGVVEMVPGSSIVALDDKQHIFLVREFKYAVQRYSLEIISGGLDSDETPLQCAKRELTEELGMEAASWQDLGMIDPFTTAITSPNYMFLAQTLTQGSTNPDKDEELDIVTMPFDEALNLVLTGEITHGASCVAILRTARILGR